MTRVRLTAGWMRIAALLAVAQPLSAAAGETFHGYPCTSDCSGHRAGFDWATRRGIADAGDCGGKSRSFIEGCLAYVAARGAPKANSTDRTAPSQPAAGSRE